MRCSIPRCPAEVEELRPPPRGRFLPPELPLCRPHGSRQRVDFWHHCDKLKQALGPAQQRSWQATWVQMVDLELLNVGIGAQRGDWKTIDGVDVWVPLGEEPRPSQPSYPHYQPRQPGPLPEHATRAGQAAIAKRVAEQELLERKLAAETADFNRGQRQVLELELKVKRATEARRKKP